MGNSDYYKSYLLITNFSGTVSKSGSEYGARGVRYTVFANRGSGLWLGHVPRAEVEEGRMP